MAEVIKLYPEPPKMAVELEPARNLAGRRVDGLWQGSCTRCPLHNSGGQPPRTVCMPADGEPGGILVVSDYPGITEDNVGRPFVGESGKLLRALLAQHYKGPIVFDNAIRCLPGKEGPTEKALAACRGYLSAIVKEAKPKRILAMGSWAIKSLTGRSLPPFSVRKGYGWLSTVGSDPVPVFFLMNPAAAARNRFVRAWLEDDLRWALTGDLKFGPAWEATTRVVRTLDDALEAEKELLEAPWFSYDVESSGFMWLDFQIVAASLFAKGSIHGWTWDVASLSNQPLRDVLIRLLTNTKVFKTGSNFKFDVNASLLDFGIKVRGLYGDTRLQRKLLDPDADADLKTMAELVGMGGHKDEAEQALDLACKRVQRIAKDNASKQLELISSTSESGVRESVIKSIRVGDRAETFAYGFMPRNTLIRYNALDTLSTRMLQEELDNRMSADAPALKRTWEMVIKPAASAGSQIEAWGISVSRSALQQFHDYLTVKKEQVFTKLRQYVDANFNPDSVQDVGNLLYKKLGLPQTKMTKGGKSGIPKASTDSGTLEALKGKHPVVELLQDWRSYSKLDGTYASGMLDHVRPDERIHPNLMLDGARSGRLSCREPNLQNIPRDADSVEGKMARDCFVAPEGYSLLSADYSQLELRIAAMLSGDATMRQIFLDGVDFHQKTAEFIAPIVWGIKPDEIKKPHRTAAKIFNFGIIYGMSDEGISARAGCTIDVAKKIREAVLGKFSKLSTFVQERLRYSQRTGVCWTWWDGENARRRPLYKIADHDGLERSKNENASFNTPIQGTGSDFCTMSAVASIDWILSDGVPAKLVLPIHDALLFEVRDDCVDELAYQVRRIMTSWNSEGVPLLVDIDVGKSWGSLTRYKD